MQEDCSHVLYFSLNKCKDPNVLYQSEIQIDLIRNLTIVNGAVTSLLLLATTPSLSGSLIREKTGVATFYPDASIKVGHIGILKTDN